MLFEFTEEELRKMECPDYESSCSVCGEKWFSTDGGYTYEIAHRRGCSLGLAIQMVKLREREKANEKHKDHVRPVRN